MANDVARAHFNAPSTSTAVVEFCEEDRGPEVEGMCGELSSSMHGTRSAARNWQKCHSDMLCTCGFRVPRGNTGTFGHENVALS